MIALYLMMALVILYWTFEHYSVTTRCNYCGVTGERHEVDCPYNLDREERS